MTEQALLLPKPFLPRLALLLGCITAVLWAGWVSRTILEPDKPQIVTVRSRAMRPVSIAILVMIFLLN